MPRTETLRSFNETRITIHKFLNAFTSGRVEHAQHSATCVLAASGFGYAAGSGAGAAVMTADATAAAAAHLFARKQCNGCRCLPPFSLIGTGMYCLGPVRR